MAHRAYILQPYECKDTCMLDGCSRACSLSLPPPIPVCLPTSQMARWRGLSFMDPPVKKLFIDP